MIQIPDDRRAPLTPQLALRVAIIGSVALAMFAVIFFRLWFLQVLSGEAYAHQAQTNRQRPLDIPAPRGQILDRNGNVLVDSRQAIVVQISAPDLPVPLTTSTVISPPAADQVLYRRLAHVLGVPNRISKCLIELTVATRLVRYYPRLSNIACAVSQGYAKLPYANVTVATDVPNDVLFYLKEHQLEFPGVQIQRVWLRTYPLKGLAAQLFGTVGQIEPSELHDPRFKGLLQSAVVGQSGLEWYYNRYLQGIDGAEQVQVDAFGRFTGVVGTTPYVPGDNLRLSLDTGLQRAGEEALAHSIGLNAGDGGAFVAMNPDTGEVYAMGSNPSFDPNVFTHPISTSRFNQMFGPSSNYPLINRAIQSAGPTGSTFKPITATAALQSGVWNVSDTFTDTGTFCVGSGAAQQCRHNAGHAVDGTLDIIDALKVSSDDFFYNLGAKTNVDPFAHPQGGPLQHWAREYGLGKQTGIDVGGEVSGTLPTPAWRAHRNELEAECDNATGPFSYTNATGTATSARKLPGFHRSSKHPPGYCGIADGTNRPWSIGDNISLAVGQGDVQVTPLQLAVVYSAIANGGWVVRPHIGFDVEQPDGTVLQRIAPPPVRHLPIDPLYLDTIRAGLRAAASQPGGTSADVMGTFPEQVYGKTGTAQYTNQNDYSWYACFVPQWATGKPIVVVVWVEQGGFGAVAAAPVARQILSQWFFGRPGPYVAGSSKTL
jgi:penicillin-binding protein 2